MSNLYIEQAALRTAMIGQLADAVDAGSAAGYVQLYDASDNALATITLNDPAYGSSVTAGVRPLSVSPEPSSVGSHTVPAVATKATFFDSDNTAVFSGSVTATGGGGLVTLANTTIVPGATVTVTGGSLTMPAGTPP